MVPAAFLCFNDARSHTRLLRMLLWLREEFFPFLFFPLEWNFPRVFSARPPTIRLGGNELWACLLLPANLA